MMPGAASSSQGEKEVTNEDSVRKGTKRKLELEEAEDDDDCVIIGEEAPTTSSGQRTDGRTGSDVLNNNSATTSNAKRPRSETIVIE